MKLRTKSLLAALSAAALLLSLTACGGGSGAASTTGADGSAAAAATGTTYKVGIVQYVSDASLDQISDNIKAELDAKGAELGVTFDYKPYFQNGEGDATVINQIASDLVADKVDVIVPIATPTAVVMQTATEDNQIPVVFSAVSDPVGAKLVASMEKPGGNITGTSDALDTSAIFKLITTQNPDCSYVGLLYDNGQDASTQAIADAKKYLDNAGIQYVEKTGTTTDEINLAAQSLIAEKVDAVFTPTDNTVMTAELSIYESLAKAGIPHYCGADSFALNGAFCGYGVDYANLGVMTADMVVDILVNGKDPATTPVQTFDNGIATVNTDTCKALGLSFDTVKAQFEPLCTQVLETTTAESFAE
jgi:putative ABC transport system substrate-binding protein